MASTIDQTISDLADEVARLTTNVGSYNAFVDGIKQALADALAQVGTLTPAQQAAFDTTFAAFKAQDQALVDAMAANVPPTPARKP